MALVPETVALPVVKGINVTTAARLLDPGDLLEAQNVRFPSGSGAKKRRGHAGSRVRGAKPLPAGYAPPRFDAPLRVPLFDTSDRGLPEDWVYGWGYGFSIRSAATPLETALHPDSGLAFGAASRDSESLVWDGHRLLSRTLAPVDGGKASEVNATIPTLRAETIAKSTAAQSQPDCADNGVIRVTTWVTGAVAYYSVTDSVLGTTIVPATPLPALNVRHARCVPVNSWIHIVVAEADLGTLQLFSAQNASPTAISQASLGECNGYFDFFKISDEKWLVAQSQTSKVVVRTLRADGGMLDSFEADFGAVSSVTTVAICWDPVTEDLGIAIRDGTSVKARQFTDTGASVGAIYTLGTTAAQARPVAIAPKYVVDGNSDPVFNVYWDDWDGTKSTLWMSRFARTAGVYYTTSVYYKTLASQAFRVGDRTFIWAGSRSTYQSTWLLLDESLRPVGKADYVVADVPAATAYPYLSSVNWWGAAPDKDRFVYHCALGYRVRVKVTASVLGVMTPAVYSEPTIRLVKMDFLHRLRWAQAGRSTYIAGAQLWAYDGKDLTEASFHLAPEDVTVAEAAGGSLTTAGKYIYRIDLCYRNAQNEEVRSASFFTNQLTLTSTNKTINLTLPTVMTRRSDAYFLIFRNESEGTLWYLVNSRDPSSAQFIRNNQSVATVSYSDSYSDAALLGLEQHPGETITYLDQFSAPACEIVAAGRDRLWVAGGEIPAGQVYPSRLFDPGECPSFHGDLAIQIDRSAEAITGIGFVGEHTVVFRSTQGYIIDSDGPDNIQQGDWTTPRLALTDIGALGPEGIAFITGGLIFQSPAGFRIFTPGGGLVPIGQPVDSAAKTLDISSAFVSGPDQEVRFYAWDGTTYVYNYQYNAWSTWTVAAAGVVKNPDTGLAIVMTPTGDILVETDGLWTDNAGPFRMRVRFGWLHAGALMDFQRVRRIGGLGSGTNHNIHVDIYYNEQDFAAEFFDWTMPGDNQNQDTFGSTIFGDGNFGDNTSFEGIQFRDSTWPWRRRPARQKCSVISIAIDDNYTSGEGFTLTALCLEIARKPGLDRTPWSGGTYSNAGGSGSTESGN